MLMMFLDNPLVANLVAFGIALLAILIFEWMKRPRLDIELFGGSHVDAGPEHGLPRAIRIVHL